MGDDYRDLPEKRAEDLADVIGRTVEAMPDRSHEARGRIYAKARTLPGPSGERPDSDADAARISLVEQAIAIVEARYEGIGPAADPVPDAAGAFSPNDRVDTGHRDGSEAPTAGSTEDASQRSESARPASSEVSVNEATGTGPGSSSLMPEPVPGRNDPDPTIPDGSQAGSRLPTKGWTLAALAALVAVPLAAWMTRPDDGDVARNEAAIVAGPPEPDRRPASTGIPASTAAAGREERAGTGGPAERDRTTDAPGTVFASPDRFEQGPAPTVDPELTPDAIAQSARREDDASASPSDTTDAPSSAGPEIGPDAGTVDPAAPTRTDHEYGVASSEPAVATPPASGPSNPAQDAPSPAGTETPTVPDAGTADGSDTSEAEAPIPPNAVTVEEATSPDAPGVSWSTADLAPQDGAPPEPSVMARARLPDEGLELVLTIRRNTDDQIPASHVLEAVFRPYGEGAPDPVSEVGAIVFGNRPASATEPLAAFPAKIADDHFVVVFNRFPGVDDLNLGLMEKGAWLDLAVQRRSGRSQILSLHKGVAGASVFDAVLASWRSRQPD